MRKLILLGLVLVFASFVFAVVYEYYDDFAIDGYINETSWFVNSSCTTVGDNISISSGNLKFYISSSGCGMGALLNGSNLETKINRTYVLEDLNIECITGASSNTKILFYISTSAGWNHTSGSAINRTDLKIFDDLCDSGSGAWSSVYNVSVNISVDGDYAALYLNGTLESNTSISSVGTNRYLYFHLGENSNTKQVLLNKIYIQNISAYEVIDISISPIQPNTTSNLTCSIDTTIPYDSITYVWQNDSSNINVNNSILNYIYFNHFDNITCNVSTDKSGITYYNTTNISIKNIPPNASSIEIINMTNGRNCTYSFSDTDGDTESNQFFKWYINNTLSSITNQLLGNGNFSSGSNISCSVMVFDGYDNATEWVNSSIMTIGDVTAPTISDFTVTSSGYTDTAYNIYVNCSETNELATDFPKVQFDDPNSVTQDNLTMTLDTGDRYVKSYTFSTVGTYTDFKVFCRDGSGNEAQNLTNDLSFTASTRTAGTSPGGGSRSYDEDEELCNFQILLPLSKKIDFQGRSGYFTEEYYIKIFNNCSSTRKHYFTIKDIDDICTIAENEVNIPGQTSFKNKFQCMVQMKDRKGSVYIRNIDGADSSIEVVIRETELGIITTFLKGMFTGNRIKVGNIQVPAIVIPVVVLVLIVAGFIVHKIMKER